MYDDLEILIRHEESSAYDCDENFGFTWECESNDDGQMTIQLNINEPMCVSSGLNEYDILEI